MNKFDKLCNQLIQEQYTITAREILYRRYGRDNAERMISSIRSRGKDNYLENKYILPDYSNKTLDRVIPVVFKDFEKMVPASGAAAYGIPQNIPFIKPHIGINTQIRGLDNISRELQTGEPPQQGDIPYDLIGHERIHTQQKGISLNPKNMFEYPLQMEFAPVLAELKFWYYKKTGIVLDANATDNQINDFINYCKRYNAFNRVPYGNQIDFEKLLRTSEGKEVFRRVVKQAPMKSNTMVA
jgi:hypothetical protein